MKFYRTWGEEKQELEEEAARCTEAQAQGNLHPLLAPPQQQPAQQLPPQPRAIGLESKSRGLVLTQRRVEGMTWEQQLARHAEQRAAKFRVRKQISA